MVGGLVAVHGVLVGGADRFAGRAEQHDAFGHVAARRVEAAHGASIPSSGQVRSWPKRSRLVRR